jgi:hypothetical protein
MPRKLSMNEVETAKMPQEYMHTVDGGESKDAMVDEEVQRAWFEPRHGRFAHSQEQSLEQSLPCEGGTGTSTECIHTEDAAFQKPPACLHPRILQGTRTQTVGKTHPALPLRGNIPRRKRGEGTTDQPGPQSGGAAAPTCSKPAGSAPRHRTRTSPARAAHGSVSQSTLLTPFLAWVFMVKSNGSSSARWV